MPNDYNLRSVLDALKEADRVGATEDARKLAEMARGMMEAQPQEGPPKSYMAKGLATSVGAPVDLINVGLRGVGLGVEEPFGGSKSIASGFRKLGLNVPEAPPETTGEYARAGVGEALGMLGPGMGTAKLIARGGGIAAQIAKQILSTMVKHPAATMTAEMTGGAGMGVGRKIGEEHPQVGPLAEIAGGVTGGAVPSMMAFAPSRLAAKATKWGLGKVTAPFTEAGSKYRAGEFIKKQVTDPEETLNVLRERSIGDLPPVAVTGEKRLMALYNHLKDLDPVRDAKAIEQTSRAAFKLQQEMKALGEGSPEILKNITEKRIAALELGMDARVAKAMETAQKKVDVLPTTQRQSQESIVVRNELERVMHQENELVKDIWKEVPKQVNVEIKSTRKTIASIMDDLATAQKGDIPAVLRNHAVLDEEVAALSVNEMQGLRSKLLEVSRQARANHQWNKARIANEVADSILEDIGITAERIAVTPEGKALQSALAATKKFKTRFEQGTPGKILGFDKTGAPRIAPELTLDVATDTKGVFDLEKVAITPEAKAATERYVAKSFSDYVLDANGAVSPTKAQKWIGNNDDLLDLFPDLRARLTDATEAQKLATETKALMEARKAKLRNPKISVAGDFLKTNIGEEVKRIFKSPEPARITNQLVRQARKDPTGQALDGLKGGFVEHLLDASSVGNFNELGEKTISGRALLNLVGGHRDVLRQLFPQEQIIRMNKIGVELAKLEALEVSKGMAIEYSDMVSNLIKFGSRVAGAAVGRHMGKQLGAAGNIQIPGYFAQRYQQVASWLTKNRFERMVSDAILSPDGKLLEALLMPIDKQATSAGAKEAGKRLNAWLLSTGSDVMRDITEEDNP